jgi:uncharacterized RDD family membrane protein YckC
VSVTLDDDEDATTPGLLPDGRPDPGYAASLGLLPATPGKRSFAFAIDAAVLVLLTMPIVLGALPIWAGLDFSGFDIAWIVGQPEFLRGLIFYAIGQGLVTIFLLVQLILHGRRGITVGKAAVGLRSVNAATFAKPGFWRMVLRAIVFAAAFTIVPYLGAVPFLLSPLWDSERRGRGWLDRIGGNWLIDVRRGIDPFDAKAMRHARKRLDAPEASVEAAMPSLATGTAWEALSFVPAARSSSGVITPPSHDGPREAWEPPEVGSPAPVVPPKTPAPSRPGPVAILVFDDGTRVEIDRSALIGRNPEVQQNGEPRQLVPVADESLQISKTHLEFGIDGGFWLVDRGSANGTLVTTPAGEELELTAWERMPLPSGSTVDIGGRSFTVVAGTTTEDAR